ncbi:MAG: L,D-transpeptidase family protein [Desulfobacterales bacterium]|nr:L,D-transpeptidase family protein [Desulfobacterales bacterium]MDJ0990785.1 L,D-transpeptidase family protein [Desulfobacterales bacterium]
MRLMVWLGIALAMVGMTGSGAEAAFPETPESLRKAVAGLQLADDRYDPGEALLRFYAQRAFQPAWQDPAHVRAMVTAVRAAETHGLDPEAFHLTTLRRKADQGPSVAPVAGHQDAHLDILLSASFLRLAHALAHGRVDPVRLNPDWNFPPSDAGIEAAELLTAALADGRIRAHLDAQAPSHPLYRRLRTALANYRRIAAAGGWGPIPEGPLLEVGRRDPRVPLVRERLNLSGDLSVDTDGDPLVYDRPLARAVLRFQERTRVDRESAPGDDEYGEVDEATLEALNVSVADRIRQLRVNLERCRWLFHDQPASFILVDMAGYRGYLFKDDEIVWRARIQVGDIYRMTPSFRSAVTRIEFNPTWTVPQGILHKTILPKIKKDRAYLERQHMQVFDRDRRPVDPATIDWQRYTAASLPYRIVQSPGAHNAVGRVKFIMPNKHFIFLHDTPHKTKFGQTDRAFSAGCIRVDKPFKLAKRLLDSPADPWTIGRIREILATGQTKRFRPVSPVPVMMVYFTAMVDDQGQVHFREDVYARDAAVVEALDRPDGPAKPRTPHSAG